MKKIIFFAIKKLFKVSFNIKEKNIYIQLSIFEKNDFNRKL